MLTNNAQYAIMKAYKLQKVKYMNFLTVQEFAQRMKIHPTTVRRAIKLGRIYASRPSPGKKAPYRIAESELERLHFQGMCEENRR